MPGQSGGSKRAVGGRNVVGGNLSPIVHRLAALLMATLPLWHTRSAQEMLHPLFSSGPTQATAASVTSNAIMLLVFAGLANRDFSRRLSWRWLWLIIGAWKVTSDLIVEAFGEELMALGPDTGVVVGRCLLNAVPDVATWVWVLNSFSCTERARYVPPWYLPVALLASKVWPFELAGLDLVPECYVLQTHGILLAALSILSPALEPRKMPRSTLHRVSTWRLGHLSLPVRLIALVALAAMAHTAAQFSTHCLTSPAVRTTDGLLASRKSVTGWISVGEYTLPDARGDLTMRYLRADHSLLGGLWVGPSRTDLVRRSTVHDEVADAVVVRNAESIYSTFLLQELVRLVVRPPELPFTKPERGLVIGLGAGLSARALYQHGVNLTVVEIDPAVYDFATSYFGFDDVKAGEIVLEDAVTWASRQDRNGRYDYIIHDVFTGGSVPAALFAEPFLRDLYGLLHSSGVIAINFAGDLASLSSLRILTTVLRVFPRCRAFSDGPESASTDDGSFRNLVLLCTKEWLVDLELRDPVPTDYLRFPSPRLREQVFASFRSREVDLTVFRHKAASADGDKWIVRTRRDIRSVEREQLEEVGTHWKVMQSVLPSRIWARW
ncbi:hypothetical protein JCM3774_004414 [Rhodotorula dairenensis]